MFCAPLFYVTVSLLLFGKIKFLFFTATVPLLSCYCFVQHHSSAAV